MVIRPIKKCPCGMIPDELSISGVRMSKRMDVSGNCCGEWTINFRSNYLNLENEKECKELNKLALAAWNEAPRGLDDEQ